MKVLANYIAVLIMNLVGHGLIYLGITFLSGKLWPQSLEALHHLPLWIRLGGFALLVSVPANLLFSRAYTIISASNAGIIYSVVVVLGAQVAAYFVDGVQPTELTLLGTLVMATGAFIIAASAAN